MPSILCIFVDNKHPVVLVWEATAIAYLFFLVWILMLALEIKVLFIYYKFGDRLTEQAAVLMTEELSK